MSKDETQLELGTLTGEERELLRAYRAQRVMPELERVRIGAWLEAASQEASQPVRKSAWADMSTGRSFAAVLAIAAGLIAVVFVGRQLHLAIGPERPGQQAEYRSAGAPAQAFSATDQGEPRPSRVDPEGGVAPSPTEEGDEAVDPGLTEAGRPSSASPPAGTPTVPARDLPRRERPTREPPTREPPTTEQSVASAGPRASSFEQERALLAAAWAALAAGDGARARRYARDYMGQFPQGMLHIEGQAIAAIAACRTGAAESAQVAQAFLARHERAPLAPRVREACSSVGLGPQEKQPRP